MLVKLRIVPLGRGEHLSRAEILKSVDEKRFHAQARSLSPHALAAICVEDEEGATDKLNESAQSVERAAGRQPKRC